MLCIIMSFHTFSYNVLLKRSWVSVYVDYVDSTHNEIVLCFDNTFKNVNFLKDFHALYHSVLLYHSLNVVMK